MFTDDNWAIVTEILYWKMSNKKDHISFISAVWAKIFFKFREFFVSFRVSKSVNSWIWNKQIKYFIEKHPKNKVTKQQSKEQNGRRKWGEVKWIKFFDGSMLISLTNNNKKKDHYLNWVFILIFTTFTIFLL